MSRERLAVTAHLTGRTFSPGQRIGWELVVTNRGGPLVVPDPLSGDSLILRLRRPGGHVDVVRLGDIPPPAGVLDAGDDGRLLPPGEKIVFGHDLAAHFPRIGAGPHALVIEYAVDGHVWRSPELPFEKVAGQCTFLDVTPNEASGFGRQAVTWVERGPGGARALLFNDDGKVTAIRDGEALAALPDGAQLALSTAPVNHAWIERWVAWLSGHALHVQFYADQDPERPPHPVTSQLPADAQGGGARLVRPLLAENVDEGQPRCTIPLLAKGAAGAWALHLLETDTRGKVAHRHAVALPGAAAGCWATAPTVRSRVFALAFAAPGEVSVWGLDAPWDGRVPAPSRWQAFAADGFLLGDVRSTLEGRVRVGIVTRRGNAWERLVFLAPAGGGGRAGGGDGDGKPAEVVHRSLLTPPEGARPVRARLDGDGGLHVLYRRERQLAYVSARDDGKKATFTSDRLGALAAETAHLVFGLRGRRAIVAYDPEAGPTWQELP